MRLGCPFCLSPEPADHVAGASSVRRCRACGHVWRIRPRASAASGDGMEAGMAGVRFDHPPAVPVMDGPVVRVRSADTALPDGIARADVAGALERAEDPRDVLLTLWRHMRPGGVLRLAAALTGEGSLPPDADVHAFSAARVLELVGRCRFRVHHHHESVWLGRPVLFLDAVRGEHVEPVEAALGYLERLSARRAAVARAIVDTAAAGEAVAIWGYGSDFQAMLSGNPALGALLAEGRLAVFDAAVAGRTIGGTQARDPQALAGFRGRVFLTPSTARIRDDMRARADGYGLAADRVVDAYGRPR